VRTCHSSVAARALAARVAAPAAPMRNGVGSTGSTPPVNTTSVACVSPQPATAKIVRSASFGVVMTSNREPVETGHSAWGRGAYPCREVLYCHLVGAGFKPALLSAEAAREISSGSSAHRTGLCLLHDHAHFIQLHIAVDDFAEEHAAILRADRDETGTLL